MFVNSGMKVWKREEQFMNNVKVQTKLIIVMLATIVALVLCAIISSESMKQLQSKALETLEADERASYDEQIKQQVDNVISLCQTIYDQYQAGVYTEEEAKKLAADEIRQLRYGDAGYFWVDQYDGTNVVLLGNDTEGTNRMETKDANGYQMVKEIIRVGQEADGGYTDYVFPKEGETEPSPKRSYSKAFEPFGWVIGTGNYTDYIDDQVASIEKDFSSYVTGRMTLFIISTLIEGIIVVLLLIMIIISIIRPLKKCISSIGVMEQGDFSQAMGTALLKRRDDFGKLAASLESMRNEMSGLIGEVKSQATEITRMVQEIDDNIQALDEEIENVSATTEELAAGMEETAASSEEINAMSHEIESAAKSIATRSQDGATEADDIRDRAVGIKKTTTENDERTKAIHAEINEGLTKALEDIKVVDQIGVLLHGSVGKYRGAGLHRTAGDEDGRDVQTQSGHQHARHDLVTVRDADQGVGTVRVHLIFHGVGDDVTARQGVQHAGVSHGDAVVNGHRVELTRNAASFLDGLGDQSTNLVQVHVAGQELIEGIGNGDNRFAEILTVHASGTVEGACAREYSSIHQFCRSHFHVLYCGG